MKRPATAAVRRIQRLLVIFRLRELTESARCQNKPPLKTFEITRKVQEVRFNA